METNWGLRPIFISAIADGKVYAFNNEHSPNAPLFRGNKVYCLNATTGAEIWSMYGWSGQVGGQGGSTAVLADGYLSYYNYYDNSMYVVGKGPSATTISASPKATAFGSSVVIEGTVMDTSAGTKDNEIATRFPTGVPAVSDNTMNTWMEYVYMQKPRPTNVTGVPVTISVVDANGNYRQIGQVTTDLDGFFSNNWKPDIDGAYTLYASFEGSNSYYPSHAVTAFNIEPATATPAPTQPTSFDGVTSSLQMTIIAAAVAIIIAVVIVGILVLRKRP
jgi:hypothetical protein